MEMEKDRGLMTCATGTMLSKFYISGVMQLYMAEYCILVTHVVPF